MTPEPAPTVQQLLAFYLEAGVDCALTDEPVNRLADPDAACSAAAPRETRRRSALGTMPAPCRRFRAARPAPGAGSRDRVRAGSGADRADAGGAARAPGKFRRLRAKAHRDAAGVRRRQPAGAHHVRRRGARARRGHRGPAVRRTFRQTAGPDDRGDRARPQQGLHRQRHSVAAARQPHADAAGNPDLPAVHPAPDRTGRIRTCW